MSDDGPQLSEAFGVQPSTLGPMPRWLVAILLGALLTFVGGIFQSAYSNAYDPDPKQLLTAVILAALGGTLILAGVIGWVIDGVLRDRSTGT